MTIKYGFSDIRDQLLKDLKGACPTKWEVYQNAEVLGEDVFGSPRPYPSAVLNIFNAQNVKFAIPFAAYRASLDGLSSLMSEKSGTMFMRHALASTIYGRGENLRTMTQVAQTIVHKVKLLSVCRDKACILKVVIHSMERRVEEVAKLHDVMIGEREGGALSSPWFGDLACAKCTKEMEMSYATWCRALWELLPTTFPVAKCWEEV